MDSTDSKRTRSYGPLSFDPKNGGKLSLTFDKAGAEHELFGIDAEQYIPIIHGKMDGRKVTLTKCRKTYPSGQNRDSARDAFTQTATVWTDTVYLGVHFNALPDIKFPWMSVSYTHLDSWLGIERLAVDKDGKHFMKPFEPVVVPITDDLRITFYRALYEEIGGRHSPYPEVLIAEISSEEAMPYAIDEEERKNTRAFRPYIDFYLRDFFNIVTGAPNYAYNIAAPSPYESRQLVKIYNRIPGYDPEASNRVEFSFTLSYDFIRSRFPLYLKTWVEKSSALKSACDMFFKRYYLSNIDIETQFSFLVQAVEAYHRRKFGDTYLECNDYIQV